MPTNYTFEFIRTDEETNEETVTVIDSGTSNEATFIPTNEDEDKLIKVKLTVTNPFGSSEQTIEMGRIAGINPPEIIGVSYTGEFIPGNIITVTPEIIGGEPPYVIEYQFINDSGDVLQDWLDSSSGGEDYIILISDLGSILAVNIKATDAGGRESETIHSELEQVIANVNLELVVDIDNDDVADIDDEDKIEITSDIPDENITKKWVLKYKR